MKLAIKLIWKNSEHNSDTVILQLHYLICNSHEKRYTDNVDKCEILLKNMLNKDAVGLTVEDKLQILYGNEWRFKKYIQTDIIDKMFEKLSAPKTTVIYQHDNADYRLIVKDKFVFLQKLMKNNKYYEIASGLFLVSLFCLFTVCLFLSFLFYHHKPLKKKIEEFNIDISQLHYAVTGHAVCLLVITFSSLLLIR